MDVVVLCDAIHDVTCEEMVAVLTTELFRLGEFNMVATNNRHNK